LETKELGGAIILVMEASKLAKRKAQASLRIPKGLLPDGKIGAEIWSAAACCRFDLLKLACALFKDQKTEKRNESASRLAGLLPK
jgi:hypothetical protein